MHTSLLATSVLSLAVLSPLHLQGQAHPPDSDKHRSAMLVPLDKIQWSPPEPRPGRSQIAIIHVDPETKATQLYFRLPPRMHARRHWHSANETNVVIRGTFEIQHDGGERLIMRPGDFNFMPKRMIHQAWAGEEETIIFVSLDGPWDVNFVEDSISPGVPR